MISFLSNFLSSSSSLSQIPAYFLSSASCFQNPLSARPPFAVSVSVLVPIISNRELIWTEIQIQL